MDMGRKNLKSFFVPKSFVLVGTCVGILCATPGLALADQHLSWFGETSFNGAYPNIDSTDFTNGSAHWLNQNSATKSNDQFGINRFGSYRALSSVPLDGALRSSDLGPLGNKERIKGEIGFSVGRESVFFPIEFSNSGNTDDQSPALNTLGVKWRHRFGDSSHLTVGARYGKTRFNDTENHIGGVSASKLASVSWTSSWQGVGERAVTGSFFFGDEKAKNGESIDASRQIYGLSVGGKWSLSERHTPFVSYRYQSGYGENGFAASDLFELDSSAHISAGWNWQVKSNWSVQAEADFAYQAPTLDLFNVSNTRLFFRTRYDLR